MKVLISGFGPFAEEEINPTALIVHSLERKELRIPDGLLVEQVILPVTFAESFIVFEKKINEFNPDIVIAFGVASNRSTIDLEMTAVNRINTFRPDNNGLTPRNELISPLGSDVYISTLPLQGLEQALKDAKIPVNISRDAGTYVCNFVFYKLMESNQDTLRDCGFIHVPQLPENAKAGTKGLSFDDLIKAVEKILEHLNDRTRLLAF